MNNRIRRTVAANEPNLSSLGWRVPAQIGRSGIWLRLAAVLRRLPKLSHP